MIMMIFGIMTIILLIKLALAILQTRIINVGLMMSQIKGFLEEVVVDFLIDGKAIIQKPLKSLLQN